MMMKIYLGKISLLCSLLALFAIAGCTSNAPRDSEIGNNVPWTDKDFLNDPDDFQFVVIGDRTGGHRPGVFSSAMQQINLLQPEFVVSVGDLIEGYTEDLEVLEKQWNALDATVNALEMPFFYTVGNHDFGNNIMRELWHRRLGRDYYHFIYRNVLFISLNTEDPPVKLPPEVLARQNRLEVMMREDPVGTQEHILQKSRERGNAPPLPGEVAISPLQLDFVKQTLGDHKDVRWTILLMHKPAWQYDSDEFRQIEEMLRDREYTVIAGHEHYYMYTSRHGRDYIDMGTTGGVWLRDGPGRLDHIAWVTMTDSGPLFANIELDGLSDKQGPH